MWANKSRLEWGIFSQITTKYFILKVKRNGVALIVKQVKATSGQNAKSDWKILIRLHWNLSNNNNSTLYSNCRCRRNWIVFTQRNWLHIKQDLLITMDDYCFLAKERKKQKPNIVGEFCLRVTNEAGEQLIKLCEANNVFIAYVRFRQLKLTVHVDITRWLVWTYNQKQKMKNLLFICKYRNRNKLRHIQTTVWTVSITNERKAEEYCNTKRTTVTKYNNILNRFK